jgi:hypothetical protein
MNPRALTVLAIVTLVVVVAAVVAVVRDPRAPTLVAEGEPAFPKLQGKVNDITEITVVHRDQKVVIARTDKGWAVPEKHGYPAQVEKVRELVTGLEDLKLAEAKTSRPDRHARLEVEEPTGVEASSVRVTLKAGADVVVDTIIGKRKYDLSQSGIAGTYVRNPSGQQAWLGRGEVDPGRNTQAWLQRKLMDVKKERVRSYTLVHADGEKVVATRATAKDENFKAESLAEGQTMKSKGAADSVATTLAFLEFEDVKPAAAVKLPDQAVVRAVFSTFDGLVVEGAIFEIDGEKWATFTARAGEAVPPPAEEPKKDDKAKAVAPARKDKVVPVADEIKAIAETAGPWVYKLPEFAVKNLTTRNAAFLPEKTS